MSAIVDTIGASSFQYEVDQARTFLQIGRPKPALEIGLRLQQQWPANAESWRVLGSARADLEQYLEGVVAFDKVVELDPTDVNAHLILALLNDRQGNLAEAISWFSKLLILNPYHVTAIKELGAVIVRIQKRATLTKDLRKSLRQLAVVYQNILDDSEVTATTTHHYHLFSVYLLLQDMSGAKAAIESALKFDYDRNLTLQNYGTLLRALGADAEAESCYREAISLDGSRGDYFYALAELILKKLDFKNGFRLYESRWDDHGFKNPKLQTKNPIWNGNEANHLLIWPEQGIGDAIMMQHLLPAAAEKCQTVTVLCDQRLIKVFQHTTPKNVKFHSASKFYETQGALDLGAYDEHIPIMSLPLALGVDQDFLRNYRQETLTVTKKKIVYDEVVEKRLLGQKMVGLSWKTNSQASTNKFRNIDIVELVTPLVDTGAVLVSLQYGDVSEDIERVKAALGVDIITMDSLDTSNDIEGLAYLISLCRHVVTIDNVTVHLAGSLGVSTHLLVPLFSDWRWGPKGRQHSYWYDSVRLHWQGEINNWSDPIMRLTSDLTQDKTYEN